jgi:hypothetical protein
MVLAGLHEFQEVARRQCGHSPQKRPHCRRAMSSILFLAWTEGVVQNFRQTRDSRSVNNPGVNQADEFEKNATQPIFLNSNAELKLWGKAVQKLGHVNVFFLILP